ncbi:MAG: hypothetical protein ABSD08_21135 [Xanthobacteraceae bacterium]|jgi:hypothetical protein
MTMLSSRRPVHFAAGRRRIVSGNALSLILGLLAIGILWVGILRNDGTPASDGNRIMKFVAFVRNAHGFAFGIRSAMADIPYPRIPSIFGSSRCWSIRRQPMPICS